MPGLEDTPLSDRRRRIRLPSPGTLCGGSVLLIVVYATVSLGVRTRRNLELINYVEGLGGQVETVPVRPAWARQLLVEVAGEERARAMGEIVGVSLRFSEEGLHRMNEIPGLRKLSLQFTPATDSGLQHLRTLENIETLSLFGSALDDDAMQYVGALTQLRTLDLTLTNISDEGLAELGTLEGLRRLHLGHNERISDDAIEDLRVQLPECEIDRSPLVFGD